MTEPGDSTVTLQQRTSRPTGAPPAPDSAAAPDPALVQQHAPAAPPAAPAPPPALVQRQVPATATSDPNDTISDEEDHATSTQSAIQIQERRNKAVRDGQALYLNSLQKATFSNTQVDKCNEALINCKDIFLPKWKKQLMGGSILSGREISDRLRVLASPFLMDANAIIRMGCNNASAAYVSKYNTLKATYDTLIQELSVQVRVTGGSQSLKDALHRGTSVTDTLSLDLGGIDACRFDSGFQLNKDLNISEARRERIHIIDRWLIENATFESDETGLSEMLLKILSMTEKDRLFVYYQVEKGTTYLQEDGIGRIVAEERYVPDLNEFKNKLIRIERRTAWQKLFGGKEYPQWNLLSSAILNADSVKTDPMLKIQDRDPQTGVIEVESIVLSNRQMTSEDQSDSDEGSTSSVTESGSEELDANLVEAMVGFYRKAAEMKDGYYAILEQFANDRNNLVNNPGAPSLDTVKGQIMQQLNDIRTLEGQGPVPELPDVIRYEKALKSLPEEKRLSFWARVGVGTNKTVDELAQLGSSGTKLWGIIFAIRNDVSYDRMASAINGLNSIEAISRFLSFFTSFATVLLKNDSSDWREKLVDSMNLFDELGKVANSSVPVIKMITRDGALNGESLRDLFSGKGPKSVTDIDKTTHIFGAASFAVSVAANVTEHVVLGKRRSINTEAARMIHERINGSLGPISAQEKRSMNLAGQMAVLNKRILKEKQTSAGFKSVQLISNGIGIGYPPAAPITSFVSSAIGGIGMITNLILKRTRKTMIIDSALNLDAFIKANRYKNSQKKELRSILMGRMGFVSIEHFFEYLCKSMAENMFNGMFYANDGKLITKGIRNSRPLPANVDESKIKIFEKQAEAMGLRVEFPNSNIREGRPQLGVILNKLMN